MNCACENESFGQGGRQQQSRRVRGELADGDVADIIAGELRQIGRQGIVEPELAAKGAERHQRCLERLSQGREVEQRVRRDGPLCDVVGQAVGEEFDVAAGIERGRKAARMLRRRGGRELVGDDVAHLRDHVGIRGRTPRSGQRDCKGNKRGAGEESPRDVR